MNRWWPTSVVVAGAISLVPAVAVTVSYYRHIADYSFAEGAPLLAIMTPIYLVLVGGPALLLAGGLLLVRSRVKPGRRLSLAGGTITACYAIFFLALWPPDAPVRAVLGLVAGVCGIAVIGTLLSSTSDVPLRR